VHVKDLMMTNSISFYQEFSMLFNKVIFKDKKLIKNKFYQS